MYLTVVRRIAADKRTYRTLLQSNRSTICKGQPRTIISWNRAFSHTAIQHKKKNKGKSDEDFNSRGPAQDSGSEGNVPELVNEAFDFSTLEQKILKAIEQMTHKFSELKAGGTLSHKIIEGLPVQVDKASPDTVKLQDIAQVVTKGRHINIIVNDEASIKPIKSAIQGSSLSLTPQGPTDDAPTTLTITVPPPTGESRQQAIDAATKISQIALDNIRDARQQKHKRLRALQVSKQVNPDDIQAASKEMEQVVQRGTKEVQMILESHKKVISR